VTVIEVSLIVTLMVSDTKGSESLARDSVFAVVMIAGNGIVGISLVLDALRNRVSTFNAEATATMLATVATLVTLTLVLPTFTTSAPGPQFSAAQLTFAALASLALYAVFVVVQTIRHREDFVPQRGQELELRAPARPTTRGTVASLALLVVALVGVVGLAKVESPAIADAVESIGAPASAVGVVLALLVLLPEGITAIHRARNDEVQTSLNLAYGSAIASIGLTIPAIALASIWLDGRLILGLDNAQIVLFALTVVLGGLTVLPGRATLQEGAVHLAVFAAFLVLAVNP
jgi:Ca2+:H+ antiporter